MNRKVLVVDDDPNILSAYQRNLRKLFDVETASDGPHALEQLHSRGPYGVIVADMRMPGMTGLQLLVECQTRCPETVRIMLTGNAEHATAIDAVNQGQVFRFLTKPCPPEDLSVAIEAGLRQYQLLRAERDLLEQTLKGSVQVLADILALTNPVAFSRAVRLRSHASQLAARLGIQDRWQVEVAALLSQIGSVTLPPTLLEKQISGKAVTPAEANMLREQEQTVQRLLKQIPRLESVAEIIALRLPPPGDDPSGDPRKVPMAAMILRAVDAFDRLISRGVNRHEALKYLGTRPQIFEGSVIQALNEVTLDEVTQAPKAVLVEQVQNGMVLAEDLLTNQGILLVPKGFTVNETVRQRIRNYRTQGDIPESVVVFVASA